ncbi:PTS system, cellobiose-specific IIC component [Pilibacter termitis]|uniref:Permease IIC component n=1 Tax=Pilibacter termitis TaxID=263852 RepID=A0A1T4LN74_9ENTE|nr:PTS transporter subunit EIIC [Pilibacter termitis]SJZ56066.1 PTS system, cellobiose-specific IIC component [Pilibacter termitis]
MKKKTKILDVISNFAQKMGSQVHFRSLRDGFVQTVPFLVLAGVFILINYVIIAPETGYIAGLVHNDALLATWQELGSKIINGSLSCYSLLIGVLISYSLAKNKHYENPIYCSVITLAVIFIFVPIVNAVTPNGAEKAVEVASIVPFDLLGTAGVFTSILSALLSTELFIFLSRQEKLKIKLTGGIPPAVAQSFNALLAIMITLIVFGFGSFAVHQLTKMDVHELINKVIQAPMLHLTTSLPGFLVLCFVTNTLFSLGIHPSGIVNPILEPPLLAAMNQNTEAFKNGTDIPNIIVLPFRDLYGHIGGTGSTIALIIAIFLVSRKKSNRQFAKLAGPLEIFNINEPVIYGFPVVMNPVIMIPFIFGPLLSFAIAYFATAIGLVSKIVVYVPWSTPPLINGYIASGGDIRNSILQLFLIAFMVVIYIPFLKAHESSMTDDTEVNTSAFDKALGKNMENEKEITSTTDSDDFSDFAEFM